MAARLDDTTTDQEARSPIMATSAEAAALDSLPEFERELLHERFVDFERSVLQENIILCDNKSGVLLAFTGAMVVYCVSALGSAAAKLPTHGPLAWVVSGALLIAAGGFLVSSTFSLTTVMPRIHRGASNDHIFWEAPAFKLPVDAFVEEMRNLDTHQEHLEKLRHLHTLAAICRSKFANLRHAMTFAIGGFGVLVAGELVKSAM